MTPREVAQSYVARGWAPIPIPYRKKKPVLEGWPKLRIDRASLGDYFNGQRQNIGILLGAPSGGLIDVDLDCPEALALADVFLPPTPAVFGRPSKLRSHRLYVCDPLPDSEPFKNVDKKMLLELRSTDLQTVFPGSVHEGGEPIAWHQDGEPERIDGRVLRSHVARLATASLLARHWPKVGGSRWEIALALAGGLMRGGWTEDDVSDFIRVVAQAAGDEESAERAGSARSTGRRLHAEQKATGWPTLAELLGDEGPAVVSLTRLWLGLGAAVGEPSDSGARGKAGVGLTRQLADAIVVDDAFARDAGGALYVYSGGVYVPRGADHVQERVKRLLIAWGRSAEWTSYRANEVVKYITVDAPRLWDRPPLDVLNVINGLLDVRSGELRPHTPEFLVPTQLPVRFDPAATCPTWEMFVGQVFLPDTQSLAWEIVAELMLPDTSRQRAVLLVGPGGNGKSTFLGGVTAFLGPANVATQTLHRLESDRFAMASLVGKLANICADLPSGDLSGTSMFKSLTGGDRITAERKYMPAFEFTPFARLVFSANTLPRSPDATEAFFDRWVVIPFERRFRGTAEERQRGELDAALADASELSGVLNRALSALPALRRRGFTPAESCRRAAEEFRATTDPLAVWLDRHTLSHPEAYVPKEALLAAYNGACRQDGRPPMTPHAMTRAIHALRPSVSEGQRTVAGSRVWVWVGLGLRDAAVAA